MSLTMQDTSITRVLIVDDEPGARTGFGFFVEELGLEPIEENGPIEDVGAFIEQFPSKADALLCDYHLKKRNYANFDGDILAAACFKAQIPSLLCTSFTDIDFVLNKQCLRYIPAILKTVTPEASEIAASFEKCKAEMSGKYHSTRKPWRQLVRVHEVDEDGEYFYVVVPGFDHESKIRLYIDNLPEEIQSLVKPGKRFHAKVNSGAESYESLYFDEWETE